MLTSTPGDGPTTTEVIREWPSTADRSRLRLATRQQPKLLTNQRDADDAELVTATSEEALADRGVPSANPDATRARDPVTRRPHETLTTRCTTASGRAERRNPLDAPPKRAARQNQMPGHHCEQRRLAHHTRRHVVDDLRGDHQDATTAPIPSADSQGKCARKTGAGTDERSSPRAPKGHSDEQPTRHDDRSKPRPPHRRPAATARQVRRPKWDSHPTHPRRDVRQDELHAPKNEKSGAPRVIQPANWGSSTSGPYSPRESVPPDGRLRSSESRCSHGLPPLQGFLPRGREPAFTGSPLTDLADFLIRRPCRQLSLRGHQPRDRLVSFETAAPREVSHLVARTRNLTRR